MNNSPRFNPAQVVIAAFGGVRSTARVLDLDASAVSRWQLTGRVPTGWQRRILEHAWRSGVDLTAHDLIFGRGA
jgi:hypothetical protein